MFIRGVLAKQERKGKGREEMEQGREEEDRRSRCRVSPSIRSKLARCLGDNSLNQAASQRL